MENYRDELVQDQNFIRCSVLIAELLIKYRNQDAKDNENHKEPDMGSVTYHLLKQHAGAKELYVRLACSDQTAYVSVTNSGAAPEGEIAEGGGLTSLRILVKKSGGSMEIKTVPRFELTVSVPVRREEAK